MRISFSPKIVKTPFTSRNSPRSKMMMFIILRCTHNEHDVHKLILVNVRFESLDKYHFSARETKAGTYIVTELIFMVLMQCKCVVCLSIVRSRTYKQKKINCVWFEANVMPIPNIQSANIVSISTVGIVGCFQNIKIHRTECP